MKNRLPVVLLNLELPVDVMKKKEDNKREKMYGYVSILYVLSIIITSLSIGIILVLRNR